MELKNCRKHRLAAGEYVPFPSHHSLLYSRNERKTVPGSIAKNMGMDVILKSHGARHHGWMVGQGVGFRSRRGGFPSLVL